MAFATSSTTGCGCCCTAASGGRLTGPQGCEAAHHAWWRRTRQVTKRRTRSHRACPPLRLFRPPVSVRPEGGAELVDHVCVAEGVVKEVLRPSAEVNAPVWRRDRPPGVQQDRSHPWNRDVCLARNGLGRRAEVPRDTQDVGDVERLRVRRGRAGERIALLRVAPQLV